MALFLKHLSPQLFLCISLLISCHSVAVKEHRPEDESPTLTYIDATNKPFENLENSVVYPQHGLSTGPPVYVPETTDTFLYSEDAEAQNLSLSNAQSDIPIVDSIKESNAKIKTDSRKQRHRLTRNSNAKSLPFKGSCISGDLSDDPDIPDQDTVELYDALNNMLEHITGIDATINDPEEIRMRAYAGERHAVGLQVILEDPSYFWGDSLVGEELDSVDDSTDTEDISENLLHQEDIDPGLLQRQTYDVDQEATLEEEEEEEEEDKPSANIDVKEGSKLRLVCNVTGVPSYRIEWQRGANLSFPGGASIVGGRSVLLDYVEREDAGTYFCTATTPSGQSHSSGVSIRVNYSPIIGLWTRDTESSSVELGCLVEGRPRPSTAWYVNNTKISLDNCPSNVEVRSSVLSNNFVLSVLTLNNVTWSDFGYYHCRASSSSGVSRGYVMLHDDSGVLDPQVLADQKPVVYPAPLENPRLSSFLLGMVPPLYIGLYIIAYLGCYKSSITGGGGQGRFGIGMDLMEE